MLLTREGNAKIGDVGLSKIMWNSREYISAGVGTLAW